MELEGQHEYTLLRGRVDSVYGRVFIEYKDPTNPAARVGPDFASPGTRDVLAQIERRFRDVARLSDRRGAALLGVGCDGRYFVFSRFSGGVVTPEEPVEVSRWSARRFLWALFNLGQRGLALTPEALAEDFGSESALARKGVAALGRALEQNGHDSRTQTFFRQWRILFGEVCGYDLNSPTSHLRALAEHYRFPAARAVELLFALHTYYALFMKLLAAHVASEFQRIAASPLEELARAPSRDALGGRLNELELGGIFPHLGVTNFLEGDLFAWYVTGLDEDREEMVRDMAERLLEYNAFSLRDNPALARDLLKRLYHELFPRGLRRTLGEYYTPDWLAELTLTRGGYDGSPKTRLLDPSCGSGTFLVLALTRVQKWLERNFEQAPDQPTVARLALRNLVGFDLNPLAVLAARTNFLIQFFDLFDYRGKLEIPIYLCDSVLTPSEYGQPGQPELTDKPLRVPTSAKLFLVPREVTTNQQTLARYCNRLAEDARESSGLAAKDFLERCRREGLPVSEAVEDQHAQLFEDIRALDRGRRNGIWARFIKNAFAPVFLKNQPVDLVVGNPPWVNWENLPGRMEAEGEANYRQHIAKVFERYGLFTLGGTEARLGGGKKDLSMLFVYACADHYLKSGGRLAFVITQTLFKTMGAGDGFRRFEYAEETGRPGRPPHAFLKVDSVDDLSSFQSFEGATNRAAVFVCRKSNARTRYPVPYRQWRKTGRGRLDPNWPLVRVEEATEVCKIAAVPLLRNERTSPWLTAPEGTLPALRKLIGPSPYEAWAGCCTWLNGVFWVRVLRDVPDGVLIENLHDVGKIKLPRVRCAVEKELLYPLLRGRDVRRWHAVPSAHILLTQDPETRAGIPEAVMRKNWPLTWAYLKRFEEQLRGRSGYRKYYEPSDPFYSLYNVGPYTVSRWKVLWPEVGNEVRAAPCARSARDGRSGIAVPDHTLVGVACGYSDEMYYLAGALNSSPARLLVRSYIVLHPSPHVLRNVAVPKFRPSTKLHVELAKCSRAAQDAAALCRVAELADIEERIDRAAARLWGLDASELEAIQEALGRSRTADGPLLVQDSSSTVWALSIL